MSIRIVRRDLDNLVDHVNYLLGEGSDLSIDHAYGQPRVVRAGGSVDVSPRLSKRELWQWLHAYEKGVIAGRGER